VVVAVSYVIFMNTVTYSKTAAKDLMAIGKVEAERILDKIKTLATSPEALANNVIQLSGSEDFRLRVGDYRVIFGRPAVGVILIKRVRHRREAYD